MANIFLKVLLMINNNYKLKFSRQFKEELQEAVNWYNLQKKGLGRELKAEVEKVVYDIVLNPTLASIKFDQVITVACGIFPYSVHYDIKESNKTSRIISFFHNKRKPNWI